MPTTTIYSLPNEILASLPAFFDNIETLIKASLTCHLLRDNFATASPATILRLAAASARTFFSPHPHFLVAATARQASDWAVGDATRTAQLHRALQGGIDGLYEFCLEHAGLTLADIRRLHQARFDIVNPLCKRIDGMVGRPCAWTPRVDIVYDGPSWVINLNASAERFTFQTIIYGELFGRDMDAFLAAEGAAPSTPVHSVSTRLEYIKYCVPDLMCPGGHIGLHDLDAQESEWYRDLHSWPGTYSESFLAVEYSLDQHALKHILACSRWRRMWAEPMKMISGDEADGEVKLEADEEDWRTRLWRNALTMQGLWGMQLVTLPAEKVDKEWLAKARWMREQIRKLQRPFETSRIDESLRTEFSLAPDPCADMSLYVDRQITLVGGDT